MVIVGRRDVVVALVEKAVEGIETPADRVVVGGAAEVPLPNHAGGVAGAVLERFRQRGLGLGKTRIRIFVAGADGIEFEAEPRLVAAGE